VSKRIIPRMGIYRISNFVKGKKYYGSSDWIKGAGGSSKHVYLVEPTGTMERNDVG
jgi:hypothetical protein